MTQPRYLALAAAALIVSALVWGLALPRQLPSRDANWISGMYAAKEAKAAADGGGELVLLSGSSGLFGLSGKMLEARLNMPVVNFSTHAGLGIKYLLHRARRVLQPGDTVFMALEYELLASQETPGQILANFASAKDPGYIAAAPWTWVPYFLTGHDYKSLVWALVERSGLWTYKQACYGSAATLNAHGDETCATTESFKTGNPGMLKAQGAIAADAIDPPELDPAIAGFIAWAKATKVKVIVGFPPLYDKPVYADAAHQSAFDKLRRRFSAFGVEVIGKPGDFLYPAEYMHDTRYHLHSKGRAVHTDRILRLLCAGALTCPG